jgi:DHA2 family multidrug resistance protein
MIRQLGGAVGIALINVFLTHKNAEIRGSMVGYVNEYNNVSADRISAMAQNFVSKGYSTEDAQNLAYKTIEGALFKQQALVGYDHGFFMVGLSILLCIPIVFLIKYKKKAKSEIIADH